MWPVNSSADDGRITVSICSGSSTFFTPVKESIRIVLEDVNPTSLTSRVSFTIVFLLIVRVYVDPFECLYTESALVVLSLIGGLAKSTGPK